MKKKKADYLIRCSALIKKKSPKAKILKFGTTTYYYLQLITSTNQLDNSQLGPLLTWTAMYFDYKFTSYTF